MTSSVKAIVSWSSGKDCAWALHEVRRAGVVEPVALMTTLNEEFDRVAMHGTRAALLRAQAEAAGLPLIDIPLPWPCPNAEYEARMAAALPRLTGTGAQAVVFGDLFLEDVRAYREAKLAGSGLAPLFPLWGRDTAALAREMIAGGLEAHVVTLDPGKVPKALAGARFDGAFLAALPEGVDPCGERGEFHTAVTAGPMFARPIAVVRGEVVEREGFVYADLILS